MNLLSNLYHYFLDKTRKFQSKVDKNFQFNKNEENFNKNPKDLKYKCDIINCENVPYGYSKENFDIYTSNKDKKQYIVLANEEKSTLNIYSLLTMQKITVLRGNKKEIRVVKYFINKNNNNNEYFITKGRCIENHNFGVVLVWDISKNYKIIFRVEPKHYSGGSIPCLIFPHYMEDFLMVTSSGNKSSYDCEYTEIYSIKKQKLLQKIEDSNELSIKFLLSWYNKNNNNYYIIQFHTHGFDIHNVLKKEVYFEQGRYISNHKEEEREFYNGFIYTKDNSDDYLCFFTEAHYLNFFNLNKKKYIKSLKIKKHIDSSTFWGCCCQMIQWNKYIIFYESQRKFIIIFDLENLNFISKIDIGINKNKKGFNCFKKIYHKTYGETLIISFNKSIELWN